MQKIIFVLLGLAAMAAADCGVMDRLKVKTEWAQVYGTARQRVQFGQEVFHELFRIDGDARGLFKRVNGENIHSPEFKAHVSRVLGGLDNLISLLEDQPTFTAHLAHLNGQHKERGIDAKYFTELGNVLLEIIPGHLDHSFDRNAWAGCYKVIAEGISS
jgi:hypothetical protein